MPDFEIMWYNISEGKNRKAGGSTRRGASSFCVGKLGKREEWRVERAVRKCGAPGKPSVSGFAGERRSSGATALFALKAETKDAELATTRSPG